VGVKGGKREGKKEDKRWPRGVQIAGDASDNQLTWLTGQSPSDVAEMLLRCMLHVACCCADNQWIRRWSPPPHKISAVDEVFR